MSVYEDFNKREMEKKGWILAQRGKCYGHMQLNAHRKRQRKPEFLGQGSWKNGGTIYRNEEVALGDSGGR